MATSQKEIPGTEPPIAEHKPVHEPSSFVSQTTLDAPIEETPTAVEPKTEPVTTEQPAVPAVADTLEPKSEEHGGIVATQTAVEQKQEIPAAPAASSAAVEQNEDIPITGEPVPLDPQIGHHGIPAAVGGTGEHDDDPIDDHGYIIESLQVDSGVSETDTDRDSTLGDDVPQSSTVSLNSTVTTFRDYFGRRYHAFEESDYWLPNDDEEMNRLDLQHIMWKITLNGRIYIAPIAQDIHRALDVGTGTGKWAIEFADDHPSCQVIGTDLSPIQPNVVPNNCTFVVDNAEEPWVFNQPFDYIHSRFLTLGESQSHACSLYAMMRSQR
jgi:hypothetical protein